MRSGGRQSASAIYIVKTLALVSNLRDKFEKLSGLIRQKYIQFANSYFTFSIPPTFDLFKYINNSNGRRLMIYIYIYFLNTQ